MRWGKGPNHDAVIRIGSKLRGGGPILHIGVKAVVFAGTRHLQPSSATRRMCADRAKTVRCSLTASSFSVCRTEDDALGHDAVADEVPQGDEQLSGQGHDHLLA
jgi:hypothetical protein